MIEKGVGQSRARRGSTAERIAYHISNLGSPDRTVARRAEFHLMRHYGARALEPLIAACDSPNAQVRYRAVWLLGRTRDPGAYDTILRLTRDPDGEVRYDAALALGSLGDARAVEPLIILLQEPDTEYCVDSAAAMGLDRLGVVAVPAVMEVAEHGNGHARVMAISVLGGIGGDGVAELLTTLASDADEQARVAAEEALEEIGAAAHESGGQA